MSQEVTTGATLCSVAVGDNRRRDLLHNFPAIAKPLVIASAATYGVSVEAIMSGSRTARVALARIAAIKAVLAQPNAAGGQRSLPQVGRMFGVHHTTVLYAREADLERLLARALEVERKAGQRRPATEAALEAARKRRLDPEKRRADNEARRARYHRIKQRLAERRK